MKVVGLLSLFLFSCAGHVAVTPRGCDLSNAEYSNQLSSFYISTKIRKKVWTSGGSANSETELRLIDILERNKISCEQVKRMRLTIFQGWTDVLMSAIPFLQRQTLLLELELQGKN
jgi:hypothetical protein